MLGRLLVVALTFFPLAARACDLCGCYSPQVESMPKEKISLTGFYAAVAEQFTHFGTLQFDDHEVANPTGQRLDSSITQFVVGYEINDRLALQFNAPFIYRDFRRPEGFAIDEGTVSGLGDVSLLAKAVLWRFASTAWREFNVEGKNPVAIEHEPDCTCSIVALAGLKFPTGNSSRLEEEFHEVEIPGAPENAIHGHDLTLGTGSYDGIFGVQSSLRYKNFFAEANGQFTLRGDGTHDYHFANDLTWNAGPGYYLVRKRETLVGMPMRRLRRKQGCRSFSRPRGRGHRRYFRVCRSAHHCFARSNQRRIGRRISGVDEHDGVTGGAGLSFACECRRKLVKIWRTSLLVYRELDVRVARVDGRNLFQRRANTFHHVASEQELADALDSFADFHSSLRK